MEAPVNARGIEDGGGEESDFAGEGDTSGKVEVDAGAGGKDWGGGDGRGGFTVAGGMVTGVRAGEGMKRDAEEGARLQRFKEMWKLAGVRTLHESNS